MRATSLGQAGILVESDPGAPATLSIVCDPWFIPAFFGSWFVFPRNDRLDDELMEKVENADYLYVSHLHGDHFDEPWLADHIRKDIGVLVPGYPSRELDQRIRALGFDNLIRTRDGEETDLGGGLSVAIHVETSITDGPGGDSALVVSATRPDGSVSRLVNQNDCRTTDLRALAAHGPVDLHWLQYSGAIWYPMVYEMDAATMRHLVDAKVESQLTRAMRYVESIGARAVVPSAGPPCFLDDALSHLNIVDGAVDAVPSIFVDQRTFLARLDASGHRGVLAIPGTVIDVSPDEINVSHPIPDPDVAAIFERKGEYLAEYRADWAVWLGEMHERWRAQPESDLVTTLREWWEPLLAACPTVREGIGAAALIRAVPDPAERDREPVEILVDFPAGTVRHYGGEEVGFRFDIDRSLVEIVVAERAVDWSNSLFLSCRFSAWRAGEFNEYVYNFLKSLSPGRMRRTEAEALRKLHPPSEVEPDIELDGWVVQRRCPHRNADLSVFAEIDGCELVCTLHGWRFDLESGRCLTSAGHPLRATRRENPNPTEPSANSDPSAASEPSSAGSEGVRGNGSAVPPPVD
jgi:UDP-MurNAc hydroxylase